MAMHRHADSLLGAAAVARAVLPLIAGFTMLFGAHSKGRRAAAALLRILIPTEVPVPSDPHIRGVPGPVIRRLELPRRPDRHALWAWGGARLEFHA